MKKYFLTAVFLFATAVLLAQPGKKPKQQEKAPTQKELQNMMKEMQSGMPEMNAEDKKILDSMGVKMPDFTGLQKNIGSLSDAQIKKAYDDDNRIIPVKDKIRISSISPATLTASTLPAYLAAAHSKVIMQLKPASKLKGEEVYQKIKNEINAGNAAASLWILGKAEIALYLMGKICIDNPTDADNLNNYSSMLSMCGAEQLAIPILNNINRQFPNNSTILNNIGQAWFGLGEINMAEKYIDSTIRIYGYHPQANVTKSCIEESKGNTTKATEAAQKAIKHGYTQEKSDRLHRLGININGSYLTWPFKPNPDPLGLGSFYHPGFPKSVDACVLLDNEWFDFKNECNTEINQLEQQLARAKEFSNNEQVKRNKEQKRMMADLVNGIVDLNANYTPFYSQKALMKLQELADDKDGSKLFKLKKVTDDFTNFPGHEEMEKHYEEEIKGISEDELKQTGEGKANKDFCPQKKEATNNFLFNYNGALLRITDDYLKLIRTRLSDEIYLKQYVQWPDEFEVTKLETKIYWLELISNIGYKSITQFTCNESKTKQKQGKLQEFDDVHCEHHSEFKTLVGSINVDCSRVTTELDLKFIKLGLKQNMDKNTFGDQFVSCTVEIGAGVGVGSKKIGPLKAEAGIGGAIGLEFDRTGLKDVVVKANAGVSVGTGHEIISDAAKALEVTSCVAGVGISDPSVDMGVEGKISLISGKSSIEGTGILQNIKLK
jgi:hypothetical protein